jgi:hypothetical protein
LPHDYLDLLQWPALLVTVIAAWLIAAQAKRRREFAFWCLLLSNVLSIIWDCMHLSRCKLRWQH